MSQKTRLALLLWSVLGGVVVAAAAVVASLASAVPTGGRVPPGSLPAERFFNTRPAAAGAVEVHVPTVRGECCGGWLPVVESSDAPVWYYFPEASVRPGKVAVVHTDGTVTMRHMTPAELDAAAAALQGPTATPVTTARRP